MLNQAVRQKWNRFCSDGERFPLSNSNIPRQLNFICKIISNVAGPSISKRVGTSCIRNSALTRCYCSKTSLLHQLRAKIKMSGPITVANYMKEVLINPAAVSAIHKYFQERKFTCA